MTQELVCPVCGGPTEDFVLDKLHNEYDVIGGLYVKKDNDDGLSDGL